MEQKKICFVVMGFGVKTDHSTGRNLDLDKTYTNLIKPAVEEAGLKCLRADEIRHSGIIDLPMYKYLLSADVVIADLSTYNPNAFYELGVRHALRPYTTIAIAEHELKYPFDINHTVIRQYEHLGKDIGFSETVRFRQELQEALKEILSQPQIDSPIYTFLNRLRPPLLEETEDLSLDLVSERQTLSTIINQAKKAMDNDEFVSAKSLLHAALNFDKNNTFVIQRLVLATYKAKLPSHLEALKEALMILQVLKPETSTDPETLGLAGAIYKRLWEKQGDKSDLDQSIYYYEKGFYIKDDYYNGINLAYLLNVRANISSQNEAITDYITAQRVREKVIWHCKQLLNKDFDSRSDQYWICATLEEAYFGLGYYEEYQQTKEHSIKLSNKNWERETTESQILKLGELIGKSPLIKEGKMGETTER